RLKRRDYPRADGEGLYRRRAIEASVDITRTRHLEGEKSWYGSEPSNNLFGDFARGLAQLASQFKRHRRCVLPETQIGRLLQNHVFNFDLVQSAQRGAQSLH